MESPEHTFGVLDLKKAKPNVGQCSVYKKYQFRTFTFEIKPGTDTFGVLDLQKKKNKTNFLRHSDLRK